MLRAAVKSSLLVAAFLLVSAAQQAWAVDLSGCWEGCWGSNCTRHKGPLQATFVKQDELNYCVHFKGRFFKLLPFKYSVVLTVVEESEDSVTLSGSHYLGKMFGTFTYTATASDCVFDANYSSCKDQGYFHLKKVAGCGSCCQ